MKKIVLLTLMILMSLSYSKTYAQIEIDLNKEICDSTMVCIQMSYIRKATIKLNERLNLIEVIKIKDSQLVDYNNLINYQDSVISSRNRLIYNNQVEIESLIRENEEINNSLKYTTYGIIGTSLLFVLSLLF